MNGSDMGRGPTSPTDLNVIRSSLMQEATKLQPGDLTSALDLANRAAASGLPAAAMGSLAKAIAKAADLDAPMLRKDMLEKMLVATGLPAPASIGGAANPRAHVQPRSLDDVLQHVERIIHRQVVCSDAAAVAVTLWIAGTYGFERGHIFPRLVFTSATKRCGKSTLLGTVARLVSHPVKADNATSAALFRLISNCKPTLLLDEVDTFFAKSEEFRGVVNAGFEATGNILRAVATPDGKSYQPESFNVYCPMAIAGIGGLPDTVLDRSIVVRLERAPQDPARKRAVRAKQLAALRDTLVPHLVAHEGAIGAAIEHGTPETGFPPGLHDRAVDVWDALLAVADLAGGTWSARARQAAAILSGSTEPAGLKETLLDDLRVIVRAHRGEGVKAYLDWRSRGRPAGQRPLRVTHIRSADLVTGLKEREDRPWQEYGTGGVGITPQRLAMLLKPFHLPPMKKRMPQRNPAGILTTATEPANTYSITAMRRVFRKYAPQT